LPGRGSKISILGQVSKPSSKRTEIISFATLSGDLKGGAHDPVEESSTYAPGLGHYFYRSIPFKTNHIIF